MAFAEEIERAQGVSGELVLRRRSAGLEIVANGVFLVSAANAVSSRALVTAAWPRVRGDELEVLIGGLGIGDALAEALDCERVVHVTVAELEPVIVRWFRDHGGENARRAAAGERAGRARLVVADVAALLDGASRRWDVVALDTDNGPEWLVRGANAGLYSSAGLSRVHEALRPGGVAVFWSPARYPAFKAGLAVAFESVEEAVATDAIEGRRLDYIMYVAHRAAETGERAGGVDWR